MGNPLLDQIAKMLAESAAKKAAEIGASTSPSEAIKASEKIMENNTPLDWNNPKSKISKYFTVEDAIMLREWNRLGNASDGLNDTVKKNLVEIFIIADIVREYLGVPVYIKSAWRPSAYNVAIGGAAKSAHMANAEYAAIDFWCDKDGDGDKDGIDCDLIKEALRPMLAQWNIRMEDNGKGARWVHIDNRPVPPGGNREFKP